MPETAVLPDLVPRPFCRRFLAVPAALAAAGALVACGQEHASHAQGGGPGAMPPAAVTVVRVAAADAPSTYEYVGQTLGSRDVEVRPRVGGIVLKRNFVEGGAVRKGQSMYSIDPVPFQMAFARAEADVASAEAKLAQAARTLQRLKPLAEARAVSRKEADDAASAEQVARADLKSAEARRAEASLNLQYTKVEAPLSGLAGRSQVSEGALVAGPTALLTTVTQIDPAKVRFGIAETDHLRWRTEVAAGQLRLPPRQAFDVELRLADGSVYPRRGKLLFSDVRVSGNTGTVEAEAELPNPDGALRPGQFVHVRLLGAVRPNAIQVPTRAVLEGPQGKFVYVVADGKAMPKPVAVGEQYGDTWVVTRGLQAGDPVIVDGMARIFFPGAPVQVGAPAASGAAASGAAARPPAAPASR